jgi:hypothetical protein
VGSAYQDNLDSQSRIDTSAMLTVGETTLPLEIMKAGR